MIRNIHPRYVMTEFQEYIHKRRIRAFTICLLLWFEDCLKENDDSRASGVLHQLYNQAFPHQVDGSDAAENRDYNNPCKVQ